MSYVPTVTLDGVPVEALVLQGVQITYGRQDVVSQPEATSCSLTLLYDSSLGTLDVETLRIGAPVEVYMDVDLRFAGTVTDVQVDRNVAQLVAVSPVLARLGRYTAPTVPAASGTTGTAMGTAWPTFQAAYATPPTLDASSGTVTVDVDPATEENAAGWLAAVVGSEPAGVLFERISTGELVFRGTEDRRDLTPLLELDGTTTSADWSVSRRVAEKINTVAVEWTGGTVELADAADVAAAGVYEETISTLIDNELDATTRARLTLRNRTDPDWQLDALRIAVSTWPGIDPPSTWIGPLEIGRVVVLPELLPGFQTRYFVEGYTERIGRDLWELELYLSDVTLTRPADRWIDVALGVTWAGMNQTLTWDDVLKEPVA
jgi:hypothetical protein